MQNMLYIDFAYFAYKMAYFCIFSLHIFCILTDTVYIFAYFLHFFGIYLHIFSISLHIACIFMHISVIFRAYLLHI